MTNIAILPMPTEQGGLSYRGISGNQFSEGKTPGEALDALTRQFSEDAMGQSASLLVIVQGLHPDRFFGEVQQQRLVELMSHWRTAQEQGKALDQDEQNELNVLVNAELSAAAERAAALADALPA